MTSPHETKTNDMEHQESQPKPPSVPDQEASGDRRQSPCSASFDAAIHAAAKIIIAGFAANGRDNPEWIAEAERIIRREVASPIRAALSPLLMNPTSPHAKRIWPDAVERAASILNSLSNTPEQPPAPTQDDDT